MIKKGGLEKDEVGIIEVKENFSFATIKKDKIDSVLSRIRNEKIQGIKTIFELAK